MQRSTKVQVKRALAVRGCRGRRAAGGEGATAITVLLLDVQKQTMNAFRFGSRRAAVEDPTESPGRDRARRAPAERAGRSATPRQALRQEGGRQLSCRTAYRYAARSRH